MLKVVATSNFPSMKNQSDLLNDSRTSFNLPLTDLKLLNLDCNSSQSPEHNVATAMGGGIGTTRYAPEGNSKVILKRRPLAVDQNRTPFIESTELDMNSQ